MKGIASTECILENVTAAKETINNLNCDELDKDILKDCMDQIWDSTIAVIELNSEPKID